MPIIAGEVVPAWTWKPNWSEPVVERLDWLTDCLLAHDGTEQRVQLLDAPRRSFEFAFAATGARRRLLDSTLYGQGAKRWALPIFPDGQRLAVAAARDAIEIPLVTATRDYHATGYALLLANDGSHEAVEILEVHSGRLVIAAGLAADWPAGTSVYPLRLAKLSAQHGLRRFTSDAAYGRLRFDIDAPCAWPAATETQYRGRPVLLNRPNWIEDVGHDFARKLAELDYGTGPRVTHDESGYPAIVQTHRWLLDGRPALGEFRAWLYARRGKYGALWVPTWAKDMVVVAPISALAVTIDIAHCGYSDNIAAGQHRRDIRIVLAAGAVFYRRISSALEVNETVERITIDAPLGVAVGVADVVGISYLALSRLDTDGVEIAWWSGELAEAAHSVRAVGHDL